MKWLLVVVVIPALLLVWRLVEDRDKERERGELLQAIRGELKEIRDDIIKEIRSR